MHHVLWIRSSGYEVVDTEVMVSREEEVVVNIAEVENVRVGDIKVEAMVKVVDIGVEVVVVMDKEMVDTEVMDTKVDTVVVEVVTREKEVVVDTKKVEEMVLGPLHLFLVDVDGCGKTTMDGYII
ncbi:hypothetical protein F2Q68_00039784 [Brassica cretica]|uniref:Uncharacterized protein n=1 Tax=Brassica cretica TaxID=69181 RepID=A0A8S9MR72_BRACR|nr:hypothetical protein F2Q68_00039784 [Brassica cretica]